MKSKLCLPFLFILLTSCSIQVSASLKDELQAIVVQADKKTLNPVLHPGEYASLIVTGIRKDGTTIHLPPASIRYSSHNKLTSGDAPVVTIQGNKVIPKEGGMATITAVYTGDGQTLTASMDIVVRPYYREYHQALVMKLFMGMEGKPVERIQNEPMFQKPHDVLCTFEQALEVIKRTDQLTQGIPKIIYLVGWQKGGHDHEYPSWATVNEKMKRSQDATALESLRWLIREGRKYNTTVSLHINMVDAYTHSPLWKEYAAKDIFAKDENGNLLSTGIQVQGDSMYKVSYTREWAEGLAKQKRIDALIKMIPELYKGHTIHVDVFIAKPEFYPTISPWHAKKENGGIDIYKEVETQRKIFKYWREKGFDVTGEGIFWAHPPGEGFYGFQPMSWWYPDDIDYQLQTPESLSARGMTSRTDDGDFRFGSSMHGEEIFLKDVMNPPGFLAQFCRTTLPWYYLSRHERLALVNDTLFYSDAVKAAKENGHAIIRKGNFVLRDNNDLFVPALWKKQLIIAYSENGYKNKKWLLPADWQIVKKVDLYRITPSGDELLQKNVMVNSNSIVLSLEAGMAVALKPAGN